MITLKHILLLLIFFISQILLAQTGFKTSLGLATDEPNTAYHIIEHEGQYYQSGQYFDQEIGYWNTFLAIYNQKGEYIKHHLIRNDTLPISNINNHVLYDGETYEIFALRRGRTRIVTYDFALDSFYVARWIDQRNHNFSPWCMERDSGRYFFCGRDFILDPTPDWVTMVAIDDSDTISYSLKDNNYRQVALNMRLNSDKNLIVLAGKKLPNSSSDNDSIFVLTFDQKLNLLSSSNNRGTNANVVMTKGMTLDRFDNILCTGGQLEIIDTPSQFRKYLNTQSIVKYDKNGYHLWTKALGNSIYNIEGFGEWKSIMESSEQDGYIVVGAESYQTEANDTLIAKAAIAKISYDGDSLWMRRYTYRSGPRVRDKFHDFIATSDGGYVAVGQSVHSIPEEEDLPWLQSILLKVDKDGLLDTSSVSTIDLTETTLDLQIYPNPVDDLLYLTQATTKALRVRIMNQAGQLIEQYNLEDKSHTIIMDTSSYDSGLYYILAEDKEGRIYRQRFVVR